MEMFRRRVAGPSWPAVGRGPAAETLQIMFFNLTFTLCASSWRSRDLVRCRAFGTSEGHHAASRPTETATRFLCMLQERISEQWMESMSLEGGLQFMHWRLFSSVWSELVLLHTWRRLAALL